MVQNRIISWYLQNKRSLPWRKTENPYFIWISEIILQQTRVAQGLPYFERFVAQYPTIFDLAAAPEEEVLRLWQGLGYYSRGRNLHQTAKNIVEHHQGIFPNSYKEIIRLKGVGPYTAAAIASFAFKERVPAIDGNVLRVISRILRIESPIDSPDTQKEIRNVAEEWISTVEPDTFNQAMMEFGAIQCTPKAPLCETCPVQVFCLSYPDKAYLNLPFKAKKTKVQQRDIYYKIYRKGNQYLLKQRKESDIWKSLYDFPEGKPESFLKEYPTTTHLLSHRKLQIHFYVCEPGQEECEGVWFTLDEIEELPKPKVIDDFIRKELV
jgi:A/G-specific adenine glycosylase